MKHTYRSPTEAQQVRAQACQFAAQVMASRPDDPQPLHALWELTTFFETYITMGHEPTRAVFGPKPPVQLKVVSG